MTDETQAAPQAAEDAPQSTAPEASFDIRISVRDGGTTVDFGGTVHTAEQVERAVSMLAAIGAQLGERKLYRWSAIVDEKTSERVRQQLEEQKETKAQASRRLPKPAEGATEGQS